MFTLLQGGNASFDFMKNATWEPQLSQSRLNETFEKARNMQVWDSFYRLNVHFTKSTTEHHDALPLSLNKTTCDDT